MTRSRRSKAGLRSLVDLLSAGFLVTGIQKYSESGLRSKVSPSKIIVHDNAFLKALERPVTAPLENPQLGFYFENSIGARLIEAGWEVYYWKERDYEVDFVALGPQGQRWAIEVKSAIAERKELKGLSIFCERYPDFEPVLVSLANQKVEGIKEVSAMTILGLDRYGSSALHSTV